MNTKKLILGLSCLMMTAGLMPVANAGTAAGKLLVKVTIGAACTLVSGDNSVLDFGTMDNILKPDPKRTTDAASIVVQCSKDTLFGISLNGGLNPVPGASNDNRMMGSSDKIGVSYTLYQDDKYTKFWSSREGSLSPLSSKGTGENQIFPVYGKINSRSETPAAGTYTDTVTVTLSF